jgi:hypothetical protein
MEPYWEDLYKNKVEVGQVLSKLWTMKTKIFLGGTCLHLKETSWRNGHFTPKALTTKTEKSKVPYFMKSCFY